MSSNKSRIARGFLLTISLSSCMGIAASCLAAQFERKATNPDSQGFSTEQAEQWRAKLPQKEATKE